MLLLLLLKSSQWDVCTEQSCSAKESVWRLFPITAAQKGGSVEQDKSSWLGEIMHQIKLRAKPKYKNSFCYNIHVLKKMEVLINIDIFKECYDVQSYSRLLQVQGPCPYRPETGVFQVYCQGQKGIWLWSTHLLEWSSAELFGRHRR